MVLSRMFILQIFKLAITEYYFEVLVIIIVKVE